MHRALEEEAEEALDAVTSGTRGEVAEKREVEQQRSGEDRVAAEEVDLDLHGVAHPAEDVDVVPAFFVVVAWRVIVDAHLVIDIAIEIGLIFLAQNGL